MKRFEDEANYLKEIMNDHREALRLCILLIFHPHLKMTERDSLKSNLRFLLERIDMEVDNDHRNRNEGTTVNN